MRTQDNKVLAVDGDILAYRTAAVCEEHFEGACESILHSTLTAIATDTGIDKMRIYLSGETNFRYDIAKTKPYKGNRKTMVRPRFLGYCKDFLSSEYGAITAKGYEADDLIATDMTINNAVHCGIDKDILQIEGRHYNYVKEEWEVIDKEEATLRLFRQVLTGDTSDNIQGLPRVGAKTAEKIITSYETAYEDAIEYYKEICSIKLPDVDPMVYFNEQYNLIALIKDVDIFSMFTTTVAKDTEGFVEQEGEDILCTSEEVMTKVRLGTVTKDKPRL